jgi:hypothetical protein
MDEGGSLKAGPEQRLKELERQVAELRRVNEQLGRDLVDRAASRQPRSPVAVGRALSELERERDVALSQLEVARQQLGEAKSGLDHYGRENAQLRAEVARLRVGMPGFLRRAQARLRRR